MPSLVQDLRIDDPADGRAAVPLKAAMLEAGHRAGMDAAEALAEPPGILMTGMGGSGAAAGLVRDACSRVMVVPTTIVQHYQLPEHVRKGWHVLAFSYSGATEETLQVVRRAKQKGLRVTGFTSGGELAKLADQVVRQPPGFMPRFALGHAWFSILGYLEGSGLLREPVPVEACAAAVREVDASCGLEAAEDNPARQLAKVFLDKVPQIYTTPALQSCAMWLKSVLNENAKRIAHVEMVPEGNHNDLVGWSGDPLRKHFTAFVLSHAGQNKEIRKRLAFMQERYRKWRVPWTAHTTAAIETFHEHVVEQARFIQFADYVSLHLAQLRGVDPGAIPDILALKAHLRQ